MSKLPESRPNKEIRAVLAPGDKVRITLETPPVRAGERWIFTGQLSRESAGEQQENEEIRGLRRRIRTAVMSTAQYLSYTLSGEAEAQSDLLDKKGDVLAGLVRNLRAASLPLPEKSALVQDEAKKTFRQNRHRLANISDTEIEIMSNKFYEELAEIDKKLDKNGKKRRIKATG